MSAWTNAPGFPRIIDGNLFTCNSSSIIGDITADSPAVLVSISTLGTYNLVRNLNAVCPSGSLVTAGGCRSCEESATAVVEIKSICLDGLISLNVSDPEIILLTTSINIDTNLRNITIYFKTAKKDNDFNLIFIPSNSDKANLVIRVVFKAYENFTLNYHYNEEGAAIDVTPDSSTGSENKSTWESFLDFFTEDIPDFFSGITDPTSLISIILYVIGGLASVVVILGTLSWGMKCMSRMQTRKISVKNN